MNALERLLDEKLIIIARGIPAKQLVKCCEALLEAGVSCL